MQRSVKNLLFQGSVSFSKLPPLSLYIHFPWCIRKCPYCDFNSFSTKFSDIQEIQYLKALKADLESILPDICEREVHSIFIGGGTPSLLSPMSISQLLTNLRINFQISDSAEITMEANPGTFDEIRLTEYRGSGINRLSLGIQSFNKRCLKILDRIYDVKAAYEAAEAAWHTFKNFNLDLMYALPEQTLQDCFTDVKTALSFSPSHLSFYQLTIEPNTHFYKCPPTSLPDEDLLSNMEERIKELTAEAGFENYEISAYAKPNQWSRHNVNYWEFGDYLGIGAGAHSKLSSRNQVLRQSRYKHPQSYIHNALNGNAVEKSYDVDYEQLPFEFMLNALRLTSGVTTSHFNKYTGLPIAAIQKKLMEAIQLGLLKPHLTRIIPTDLGFRFLSDLQSLFLYD